MGWIDAIDAIADKGFWGCGLVGMEENKKSASPKKKLRIWLAGQNHVWRCWRVGHGCGEAAAEKGCTPTVNALPDSEVRRDYMAVAALFSVHATKAGNYRRF